MYLSALSRTGAALIRQGILALCDLIFDFTTTE